MEWIIAVLTIVFTPILTLIGIVITEKYKFRSKKMEIDLSKNEAIQHCQQQHSSDISAVRKEFNDRLDILSQKLDDIKYKQQETALQVKDLQADVQKHNNLVERTYELEKQVGILRERIS